MSTITSSVSPAASPRPSGYVQYRAPPTPRQAHNSTRPSIASRPTAGLASPVQPSPRIPTRPQYADAGTQYSPDGLPPTASAANSTAAAGRNKRKQTSPDPPMTQPSSAQDTPATPPPEPQLRVPPNHAEQLSTAPERAADDEPVASLPRVTAVIDGQKKARTDSKPVKEMPRQYETCDPKDLGVLIADMLMELIRLNDKIPLRDGKLTRFHSRAPPGISCHDYLNRLIQHATLSPPILLSMVYYIDRLCALYPAFTIGSLTVHRFLITAATVASKGLSDSFWTNSTYARIGGISTGELATLELDFLQRVHFRIVPQPETLVDYYYSLVQRSQDYRLEDEPAGTDVMDVAPT